MPYLPPAPSTLGDIYSMNPGAFTQAQGLLDLGNQGAQQELQRGQQVMNFDQEANPMRLQQMGLANQTASARLPGVQAESGMQQRKNDMEELFKPESIASMRQKYGREQLDNYSKEIADVGEIYSQGAGIVAQNPVGGVQAVKAALKQAGHEDMWNPAWDNLPPEQLFQALSASGQQIQKSSSKYQSASDMLDSKMDAMKQMQSDRLASQEKIASMRAASQQRVAELKKNNDPKTLEGALTKAVLAYQQETDPDKKQILGEEAMQIQQQYSAALILRAQAPKAGEINVPAVADLPARGTPGMPPIGGPKKGTAENPIKLQ